jgi:hypothetical protein
MSNADKIKITRGSLWLLLQAAEDARKFKESLQGFIGFDPAVNYQDRDPPIDWSQLDYNNAVKEAQKVLGVQTDGQTKAHAVQTQAKPAT